ncbi:MAG: exonuclease subunit SbcD [Bacteroidia bacterium]|nr:exonuclease subunit SbcD [Bacteroidia bacterium]
MKLLHTSDWHLGKRLENLSRLDEQKDVLKEICGIAETEQVDAVIVSGDLFDTYNPSAEAVELFYKTLKRLANNGKRAVIAIAGNHDSPDRIEAPDPLARECGILFAGYPNAIIPPFELESGLKVIQSEEGFVELLVPGCPGPLRLLLTPYANEFRLKAYLGHEDSEEELRKLLNDKWSALSQKYCDNNGINILISHLFFARKGAVLPEEPEDEKPILHVGGAQVIYSENIPSQIQYCALGHLHRKQTIDSNPCPVIYCGSPLSYSFAEADQKKYVVVIEAEPGKTPVISNHELTKAKRLLRKRAFSVVEAIEWLKEHQSALIELTMSTDTYLTAEERKLLNNTHNGIISIIPDVKSGDGDPVNFRRIIDLSKSMEELFTDYFRYEKGQEPNQQILNLFKEVLAEDEE